MKPGITEVQIIPIKLVSDCKHPLLSVYLQRAIERAMIERYRGDLSDQDYIESIIARIKSSPIPEAKP